MPLDPSVSGEDIDFALLVMVYEPLLAENETPPVAVHVIPDASVRFPPAMNVPDVPA
jgi:hypothetical protein